MSRAPSMPLFIDAYLADTTHLSAEEHGAYLLLLMAMWRRNGAVPDDDKDNARIVRLSARKWCTVKERLLPLLTIEKGELTQKRLQKEWNYVAENSEKQRQKGIKSGYARSNKNNNLNGTAVPPRFEPQTNPHTHTQYSVPNGTGGEPPPDALSLLAKQVYEEGKALVKKLKGVSDGTAGGYVTDWLKASANDHVKVLKVIREAGQEAPPPADVRTWVMARVSLTHKPGWQREKDRKAEEFWNA